MIKVNGYAIEQNHFPDSTLHINTIDGLQPNRIEWFYENDGELFTLICLRKHYGNLPLELYMPYIPHARMDRVKENYEVFTLKHFCDVINSLNFNKVMVFDPHSNVSTALLNNVYQIPFDDSIQYAIDRIDSEEKKDIILFYPDEGAMKRYSSSFPLPYTFGIKKRDWRTGRIESLQLMDKDLVKDHPVLIIDDICSRGGTFYHAANALKEAGAENIYLYVSHAEHTMIEGDMYVQDVVKKIFTTGSIFRKEWDIRGKVEIV